MAARSRAPDSLDEPGEALIDRAVGFAKGLGSRLASHARSRWKMSGLSVDIGLLKRRHQQEVLALGYATYEMMREPELDRERLQEHFDEIRSLERQIEDKRQQIASLEREEEVEDAEAEEAPPGRARRGRRFPGVAGS